MRPLSRTIDRLTHRRSRRSQLWACVYRGAFGAEPGETDEPSAGRDAD